MPLKVPASPKVTLYVHTSPSGKRYVGQTVQEPKKRWQYGKGYRHCQPFRSAIEKYGWNNIEHDILFETDPQNADRVEKILIGMFRTNEKKFGYNVFEGGNVMHTMPQSTRDKISKANKGKKKPEWFGKMVSERQRGEKNHAYGKPTSENAKRAVSEKMSRPVLCVETGIIYKSISAAAIENKCDASNISKVCRKEKHTCRGLHWEYAEKGGETVCQ